MLFLSGTVEGEVVSRRVPEPGAASDFPQPVTSWYLPCKAAVEFLAALVLFVFTLPAVLLAAALVKLTSRGPAFYSQTRLGLNGRPYTIRKLRTMVHNCESLTGAQWSRPKDPRITPLGRFLRRSHLDEFPQLWNVLCGEMSLIGPRPERPEFVPYLEHSIPHYRERLRVRPGITGLAQVQLPPDTDLASVRRKLAYDLFYVRHASPWLDLKLFFCTGLSLIGMPFAFCCQLLRVPGGLAVEQSYCELVQHSEALVPLRAAASS